MSDNQVRIQDDLFHAVNGEWLETAVIPDDRPTAGGFAELDENVQKLMMSEFEAFANGEKTTDIPEMAYAIKLYQKFLDTESRNKLGITPLLPKLEKIKAIRTPAELNEVAAEFLQEKIRLPLQMQIETDMKNATNHAFYIMGPEIILPDTTFYEEGNPAGPQLLGLYRGMAQAALAYTPLSPEEQAQYLDDTFAFDALVAKKVKSQLELADYVALYNPMDLDEAAELVKPLDLKKVLQDLYGKLPSYVVIGDPRAIREMSGYFSEETFPLYIHWAYVQTLLDHTSLLSEDLYTIGTTYRRALMGVPADPELKKRAYQIASALYSQPVGLYYGRTYFGEEAKKDVVDLVKKVIATYEVRVGKNTFLSPATKEKAILKLSTIKIKMGYPDELNPFWSTLVFDDEDSYFDAVCKIYKIRTRYELDQLYEPVDRSRWGMPGHMVNACYNPFSNDITFPAAILQKPFYSIQQTQSENLGGIGAVIGHEISHAFDNNGAKFDENGNLANWWTDADFAAFKALTKGMIEQFDGIPFHGGKVNGELVVSENIADNGGLGVTLEIMHHIENPDFQGYFKNWARVWCMKAKEEYIQLLLAQDVHSPNELRANMAPRNFNEWYEAFDVKETDKMYIAPEKRISIW